MLGYLVEIAVFAAARREMRINPGIMAVVGSFVYNFDLSAGTSTYQQSFCT
jgi:hypothetical protein